MTIGDRWRVVVLLALAALGCDPGEEHAILIEVSSPVALETLAVLVEVAALERRTQELPLAGSMPSPAAPARVAIALPGPSSVRVYAIGRGVAGEIAAAVRCYEVTGIVRDTMLLAGSLPDDADADGFTASGNIPCLDGQGVPCTVHACASFEGDCDDANPLVHPLQIEVCGADLDCDLSPGPCPDADVDGFAACPSPELPQPASCDCDDGSNAIRPDVMDVCGDAVDQDCDGVDTPCDADMDGSPSTEDCDDTNPARSPASAEMCTIGTAPRVDEDCDGSFDEGGCSPADRDGDGTMAAMDCDDCDPTASPGAIERCGDAVDQDCDGSDPPCPMSDADGDGAPSAGAGGTDCDDEDPLSRPNASERCASGLDEDCDTRIDESCPVADTDGDGWAEAGDQASCEGDAMRTPGAVESCDGDDDDCDGRVDEDLDASMGCVITTPPMRMPVDYSTDLCSCGSCDGPMADCAGPTGSADLCMDGDCGCSTSGPSRSPGPACAAGDTCCESGCRDTQGDVDACGGCQRACSSPGEQPRASACVGGRCRCGDEPACSVAGTACCDTMGVFECRSLLDDPRACGACGVRCGWGESCVDGACVCGETRVVGGPVCRGSHVCCPSGQCKNGNSC